ncbi:MAG: YraN family protein [Clostridiales bacterium]|nr:YraN family protein [Clostridiales bacterium]
MNTKIKGRTGEDVACAYLKKKKYEIIERNFTTNVGEIDIIAAYDGYIVFVEVKARRSTEYGVPAEAVTYFKQRKISQVASQFLSKYRKLNYPVRFDVVEVYMDTMTVNHIENAFDSYLRY